VIRANSSRTLLILTLTSSVLLGWFAASAQTDREYATAVLKLYISGGNAGLIRDWCNERSPGTQEQVTVGFAAWQNQMNLPKVQDTTREIMGDSMTAVEAEVESQRTKVYEIMDRSAGNANRTCAGIEQFLLENFNLRKMNATDYATIAAWEKANASGSGQGSEGANQNDPGSSGTGSGSKNSGGTNSGSNGSGRQNSSNPDGSNGLLPLTAKLPNIPAFDYLKFAKTKLNPDTEPIPDEYVCWGNFNAEAYKTPHMLVQILPGRKYRAAFASSTTEGSFGMKDNKINFNSGAFSKAERDSSSLNFSRSEGSSLTLNDPLNEPGADGKRYYTCSQRGLLPWKLLEFQRKDPQPGTYACIKLDGKASSQGTLEVLSKRRYRYDGQEGAYSVDITGGRDSAKVEFTGRLEEINVWYAADTLGRQTFQFDQDTPVQCIRSVKAQPIPKFGPSKAPPAPGKGGLEGRYYDLQTNFNGANMTFWFYFFQKDGYVYTDDATDTEGLMDIDCTKTYPSGIPLCQPYSLKGDGLRIGNSEPVKFKRVNNGLEIDGRDCSVLESADGLKLNAIYESTSGQSNAQLYFYNYWSSEIEFKTNGSFFQAESSKTGNVVTDNSTYRPESGTYRIYGNTLEFKFKDGSVVRKFLIVTGERKDLKYIHISGVLYWIKDEKK
jgi:hypothetical protein